ncbi:GAF domain-containing protein [Rubrobacter tropicus]|uniref:GAF domain-containing protein n=1 Tax=Rubrobacter tropicus TaxID=2653851 RepID=A0A6G8QDW2_9ACTN|nr:LuxR C-terminal-related transcriptional regulator [Rubrobacter tropicus]QIN84628.1 GAF domain-containing protein [Rubrobacter tropicus]
MVGRSAAGTPPDRSADRPSDRRLSEVLVTLARLVLAGDDAGRLAREAVLAVAKALDADRCEVLRPAPGGKRLLRIASCGEDPGRGGRDAVPSGVSSAAGYALLNGAPVVSEDLERERRFGAVGAPRREGPVSAVAAPFSSGGDAGVLVAYAARAGAFDAGHALTLGRISYLLGGALRRLEEREELRRRAEEAERRLGAPPDSLRVDALGDEVPTLTARQSDVLTLMADGRSAKRIASELRLSIHTVHFHQRNLYRALGVGSSTAALKRAAEMGLLRPPNAGPSDR